MNVAAVIVVFLSFAVLCLFVGQMLRLYTQLLNRAERARDASHVKLLESVAANAACRQAGYDSAQEERRIAIKLMEQFWRLAEQYNRSEAHQEAALKIMAQKIVDATTDEIARFWDSVKENTIP